MKSEKAGVKDKLTITEVLTEAATHRLWEKPLGTGTAWEQTKTVGIPGKTEYVERSNAMYEWRPIGATHRLWSKRYNREEEWQSSPITGIPGTTEYETADYRTYEWRLLEDNDKPPVKYIESLRRYYVNGRGEKVWEVLEGDNPEPGCKFYSAAVIQMRIPSPPGQPPLPPLAQEFTFPIPDAKNVDEAFANLRSAAQAASKRAVRAVQKQIVDTTHNTNVLLDAQGMPMVMKAPDKVMPIEG